MAARRATANGGGLFVGGGSVSLGSTPFNHDLAKGGNGGTGGVGGFSFLPSFSSSFSSVFSRSLRNGRGGQRRLRGRRRGRRPSIVGGGSLTLGVTGATTTDYPERSRTRRLLRVRWRRTLAGDHRRSRSGTPKSGWLPGAADLPIGGHHGGHRGDASSTSSSSSCRRAASVGFASGGAIYVAGGSVTLFDQNISHDLANYGGAIYNRAGTVSASGLTMTADSAESGGAVLNAHGAHLTIKQRPPDRQQGRPTALTATRSWQRHGGREGLGRRGHLQSRATSTSPASPSPRTAPSSAAAS